jgi:AcrR family transcriptional regulator
MRRPAATTPRKRPRQERSRATVDAILQATAYILVREGYAALTTNRVAEKAGVNIASLYQYFPNKQALVTELQRRHVETTRARAVEIGAAHSGQSGSALVRAMVEAGIAAHAVEPELHRVFEEEMPRLRPGRALEDDLAFAQGKRFLAAAGLSRAQSERVAWIVRTAAHAIIHHGVSERPADLRSGALADELVLLLQGYLHARGVPP